MSTVRISISSVMSTIFFFTLVNFRCHLINDRTTFTYIVQIPISSDDDQYFGQIHETLHILSGYRLRKFGQIHESSPRVSRYRMCVGFEKIRSPFRICSRNSHLQRRLREFGQIHESSKIVSRYGLCTGFEKIRSPFRIYCPNSHLLR